MKNLILIFSMLLSLTSCTSNDTSKQENLLIGTWNLMKFENGFSPTENFSNGDIIWNFQENGNVSINSLMTNSPIKPNGSYNYSLTGNRILIGDTEYDYEFNNSILFISDNPSADGFKATFTKQK